MTAMDATRLPTAEPVIRVGLVEGAAEARLEFEGSYVGGAGEPVPAGEYVATLEHGGVVLRGEAEAGGAPIRLSPADLETCRATVHDVTIGKGFHWQRRQSQEFQGTIECLASGGGLTLVNELPLEHYLTSVISSEMRASCPAELLKAHAIVSRSWLLAQIDAVRRQPSPPPASVGGVDEGEIVRWYDRESHALFDVCADDHCQRYQGITRAFSPAVFDAVRATAGVVLVHGGAVCDARYSKCCGGMTEAYATAWEDCDVPYLQAIYDGKGPGAGLELPSCGLASAERWILSSPPANCNRADPEFLAQVLPGFDQETRDFYRWEVVYSQEELGRLLDARLGRDLGRIAALEPLERGPSGRLRRLRIHAERGTLVIGKELEIRRALSASHLLSSAFVVRAEGEDGDGFPLRLRLIGAGWGHGVGLCQIGAASMADEGADHETILTHYFRGAALRRLYPSGVASSPDGT